MQYHQQYFWNEFFDLNKIKRMGRRKKNFRFRILSDGIAVSLQYDMVKRTGLPMNKEHLRRMYESGIIPYEIGIDPNEKTFMAIVRRDIRTGKEVSFIATFIRSIVLKQRIFVVYSLLYFKGQHQNQCQTFSLEYKTQNSKEEAKTMDC